MGGERDGPGLGDRRSLVGPAGEPGLDPGLEVVDLRHDRRHLVGGEHVRHDHEPVPVERRNLGVAQAPVGRRGGLPGERAVPGVEERGHRVIGR
jgi:hypothetical protein